MSGRHPKSSVALVILFLLHPGVDLARLGRHQPGTGQHGGGTLTEWVRDHGGGPVVTWAENTWYTWHAPPKGGKPAKGAIPAPVEHVGHPARRPGPT